MSEPTPSGLARHPHLAEPCPPGWVRVDMHVHTMWSGDASTTPQELADAVRETGLDVLCVTDHGTIAGATALAGRLPCRIVVGQEHRVPAGELIGLFLTRRLPAGLSATEGAGAVRAQGGLAYAPHPLDPARHCLDIRELEELAAAGLLDAVEVLNAKTPDCAGDTGAAGGAAAPDPGGPPARSAEAGARSAEAGARSAAFAAAWGIPCGAGSDAHVPEALGAAFAEMPDFDGPASFAAALRHARLVGHHCDPPRTWRPAVIPSDLDRRGRPARLGGTPARSRP
ncbi:MAG: PHP-associated domain-containing protein [Acidimicrobiales bacterium]